MTFCLLLEMLMVCGCKHDSTGQSQRDQSIADDQEEQGDQQKQVQEVVLYCSVDEHVAKRILDGFEKRSGVHLTTLFDSEAGKTTGLINRIIQEAKSGRPRADVFWSSEIFGTIRLAREGYLAAYRPTAAADISNRFKDASGYWTAIGLRPRVIAYDPNRLGNSPLPQQWKDLAKPEFASKTALANPLFGTTRGHVAAMFALWGGDQGREFLTHLRERGALIVDSNGATVRAVLGGRALFAATDIDDVNVANRSGASLEFLMPDMGDGGTLAIPCTVSLLNGGPHPKGAQKLAEFLVSTDVERLLAQSVSGNIPVREQLREQLEIDLPSQSTISYDRVTDAMDDAVASVREILLR